MLRTGNEYLDSIRDDRRIFVGDERVNDVTQHPGFRNAAHMYAALFDMKAAPENAELLSYEEDGERCALYYLKPKTREDLVRRTKAHKAIADFGYGLLGRSPDHVAASITGFSMQPEVFDDGDKAFSANVVRYQQEMRSRDLFTVYAILPPQGARNPEYYQSSERKSPTLRVVAEDDNGVTLTGMKMLATGAAFCNDIIIGNILPLAPTQIKESITCIVPANADGLALWSRKPVAGSADGRLDNPLSYCLDESDCMVVFKDVKVPWEQVFVHDNPALSREIYIRTPGHCMSNHQSNVRFWAKLQLLVGLASRVTESNGARDIPAVRETLGRLAAMEACYAAMIEGQHQGYETLDNGYVLFNRRYMYAAVNWAMEHHSELCDLIRTLSGGGVFQMPASASVLNDPELRETFEDYWSTPTQSATDRMKLFRLAWDIMGSELAGRHQLYEKFYVGPSFSVRNYNFINAPWDEFHGIVDDLLAKLDHPVSYG